MSASGGSLVHRQRKQQQGGACSGSSFPLAAAETTTAVPCPFDDDNDAEMDPPVGPSLVQTRCNGAVELDEVTLVLV